MVTVSLRPAMPRTADADALAQLIAIAGEGLPQLAWAGMAEPGESVWDVGRRRAQREEGSFTYRKAVLAEVDGQIAACVIGSALPETPEVWDPADVPALFVPLLELEDLVPGTWYVNVLAAYDHHRGRGLGSQLLSHAEDLARAEGIGRMSIIVRDRNRARGLYVRTGYEEVARREIVREDGWDVDGRDWVLMVKAL